MGRIAIADEQPVTRHAVRILLEKEGLEVVFETADGLDALRAANDLRPDLVIVGLRLARLGGLEVVRRLHDRKTEVRTLVLAAQDSEHFIGLCREAGASGFVSTRDDLGELNLAVRSILQNHSFFPAPASGVRYARAGEQSEAEQLRSLSPREMTVLYYLASGYTNRAIADELLLSDRTVSTYKVRLFRKLNLSNMMELAELAWRHNILGPGETASTDRPAPWQADQKGRDLLRTVLNAIPAGVCINDVESRILFANDFLLARYGRKLEDVLGKRLSELRVVAPAEAAALEDLFAESVQQSRPFAREVVLTYDGDSRAVLCWGTPVRNPAGETVAMVCGAQNFSDQEETFLALREAKERAEAANRAKSRLVAQAIETLRNELLHPAAANDAAPDAPSPRIRAIEARLDSLQALVEADATVTDTVPVRCDVLQATTEPVERLQQTHADIRFTLDTSGVGPSSVWLDRLLYQKLVTGILTHAWESKAPARFELFLRTQAQSRALVTIELEIREVPENTSNLEPPASPKMSREAWLPADGNLARKLGAELVSAATGDELDLVLRLTVAKASSAPAQDRR
jgi:PAS domain S-box-containing protein